MSDKQKAKDSEPIVYVKVDGEFTEEELASMAGGARPSGNRVAVSSTYNDVLIEEGGSGADKDYING